MPRILYIAILVFIFFTESQSQSINKEIINSIIHNEDSIFSEIGDIVEGKRLIILGESSHQEGKTFEYKTKIVSYLAKHHGFNVVALEGGGYFDFQLLNSNLKKDTSFTPSYYTAWYPFWSRAKQTKDLIQLFKNGKIEGFGMENQPTGATSSLIKYCKQYSKSHTTYNWNRLDSISNQVIHHNLELDTNLVIYLNKELSKIKTGFIDNKPLYYSIENYCSYLDQFIIGSITYEDQNKGVNVRDRQMAKNVIQRLKDNPEDKMIIWTANFHGARNIEHVTYDESDPDLYNEFKLLGGYLSEEYGDDMYSLAFTSHGEVGDWWKEEKDTIPHFTGNFEEELFNQNKDLIFIDFDKIMNKDQIFDSSILGHSNKRGKWLRLFDGVFYIRNNEKVFYGGK